MSKVTPDLIWEKWEPLSISKSTDDSGALHLDRNALPQPVSWKEKRIVEISHDFFANGTAISDEDFYEVYSVIKSCPHHIFILSTTRPMEMDTYLTLFATRMNLADDVTVLCPNILKGLFVSSQKDFDMRRTYISYNPLLIDVLFMKHLSTYINITEWLDYYDPYFVHNTEKSNPIKWIVIEGGEAPMHPGWVRDIIKFGNSYSIPVYFKSWGDWIPVEEQLPYQGPDVIYLNQNGDISKTNENIVNVACLKKVGRDTSGHTLNSVVYHAIPHDRRTSSPAR